MKKFIPASLACLFALAAVSFGQVTDADSLVAKINTEWTGAEGNMWAAAGIGVLVFIALTSIRIIKRGFNSMIK